MSSAGAVSAGTASTTRNAATPARMTRMRMPAPLGVPAKTRSPGRRTDRPVPAGDGGVVLVLLTAAPWCVGRCPGEVCLGCRGERGPPTARGAVRHPGPLPVIVWSAGGDRVHSSLRLLAERVGDGGGTGGLGRGLLTLLADHVPHEVLDQTGLLLVVIGDAADVVADQDDRVAAGLGGVAGELDGEVVLG